MKKGIIVFLVVALAAGGGAAGYYYWKNGRIPFASEERVSSDSEDAIYVDSVKVLAGLGSGDGLIQRYAGMVEPQQTWEVKLENERTVKECFVKEGDTVKEGQKLFTYDTTEDEDKLAQAEIDLERCANDIETAKSRMEQYEKEKKSASADEQLSYTTQILQEQTTIKMSEYEYKSKELEISQLKENISDSVVTCNMEGIVKSINDPNDNSDNYSMDSGDAAYITVLQVGDYRVKGTVNEQNINQISEGMDIIIHSRVDDTLIWRGVITEINRDKGETSSESSYYYGASSDDSTSSTNYPFYVELDSSEGLILGQHVYMEPDMGQEDQKEGIWLDDYYFVVEDDGSAYTWAASTSNVLEKRVVTLGDYDEELAAYQVLEGLNEEDYITVPYDELVEGLPVIYNDYTLDGMFMDGENYGLGMEYDDSMMYDEGMEYDDSMMYDEGMEYDDSMMYDEGMEYDDSMMYDEGMEYDDSMMYDEGMEYDDSMMYDEGMEYDDSIDYYDADEDEEILDGLGEDTVDEENVE